MEHPSSTVPGAQAIARAARLLRLVSAAGAEGRGVRELADEASLSRSTAHRLLTALRVEGLGFGYGERPVLQDISFRLQPGRVLAVREEAAQEGLDEKQTDAKIMEVLHG